MDEILRFEEYAERYACMECGAQRDRDSYESYLRDELRQARHVLVMSPEERARWDREQAERDEWSRMVFARASAHIAGELRPRQALRPPGD